MLDYFLKRSAPPPAEAAAQEAVAEAPQGRDKEIALQQAKTLGSEQSAVEFILQCQFADARLIAAEGVHSKAMLERLLPAIRNADRRVAKLMQARLDLLSKGERTEHRARECIERAFQLADEQVVLPNQVVDLDHAWQLIGTCPDAIRSEFDNVRSELRERLEAQAGLQRAVIDSLAHLRELSIQVVGMTSSNAALALDNIEQQMAQHLSSREAPSLPKNLLSEFAAQHQQFKAALNSLAERHQVIDARRAALERWEDADARADLREEALRRAWQALPTLPNDATCDAMQLRFDALAQSVAADTVARRAQIKSAVKAKPDNAIKVGEMLESMEKALQEGAVRASVEIDKQLRSSALQGVRLSQEQAAHLAKMRGELSHLQGWAKWGGNVSREELLKAAEELPGKALAAPELAKKVGGLRERWKSLEPSTGSAGKVLWERFDAACTLAYAPAAAHFKKLADERQGNLLKAKAIVAEIRQFAVTSKCTEANADAVDWRAIASFCAHTSQIWQRLGSIDRKDKKRLDVEFNQGMQLLKGPLGVQQQVEAARRKGLIAETLALNPVDRNALEAVRGLQERWQQIAKSMPLERKAEQALWQTFRAACDTIFATRKEAAAGADADRRLHLAEKENLCVKLEIAIAEPSHAIVKILREAKDAWGKIGPAPRAMENQIEARFQAAVKALQKQLDVAKRAAADTELNTLLKKIRLCLSLEHALADGQGTAPVTLEQWQALPGVPVEFERLLRARFEKALGAMQAQDGQYKAMLEKSRIPLLQSILRFEIVAGVESPAGLSRERLRMQVEVLQSTLKTGSVTSKRDVLLELCKTAALCDPETVGRIEQLIGKLNGFE